MNRVQETDPVVRLNFFYQSRKVCPKCSGSIKENRVTEDCRRDGDAYGQHYYYCNACNWFTKFEWDEASSPYYFEIPELQTKARQQIEASQSSSTGN